MDAQATKPYLVDLKLRIPRSFLKSQTPNLPAFKKINHEPKSKWKNMSGAQFASMVDEIYNEITKWRKNLFKMLSGRAEKQFVTELSSWLERYNKRTDFRGSPSKFI